MLRFLRLVLSLGFAVGAGASVAAPSFVNGLLVDGNTAGKRTNRGLEVDAEPRPNATIFRVDLSIAKDVTDSARLEDGSHLVLAGADNDDSVTQYGTAVQFDVCFKPDGDPKRIQCDIGTYLNGAGVADDGAALASPPRFSPEGSRLIPGVPHAYKATAADLLQIVQPGRGPR